MTEIIPKSEAKNYFFRIGAALILLRALTTGIQKGVNLIIAGVSAELYTELVDGPWYLWALSILPLYLVALPVFLRVLPTPPEKTEMKKFAVGKTVAGAISAVPVMYIGNIIGIITVAILSFATGNDISNGLVSMVDQSPVWLTFLCMVIIAPLGEELIFRKLLCDRLSPFGECSAVIFSGLAFGLFHGNFSQFFYAAGVGLILAYIYVRTKNIFCSVAIHMFINLFGGVIAPSVLTGRAIEILEKMAQSPDTVTKAELSELYPLFAFVICALLLFVVGIILLVIFLRRIKFDKSSISVEDGTKKALWGNPAILAALALMLVNFILYII
ncbi:MAG: CPBP family intramembrane metalloprotease [Ruminococcaceae bacterium]|nr:CPBP family intramembrane metalloprotease [Oscillospiraceae bacterium]